MPKFQVTIREARWRTVTFECEADSLEEVEDCPFDYEPEDAKWEDGDTLSMAGEVQVKEIPDA